MKRLTRKTRRLFTGIFGLLIIPGFGGIGFFLPDSVMMILEGGYGLWHQVWIEWNPDGFDSWVFIWGKILGGCIGAALGFFVWYAGVVTSGLLTQKEMEQFVETREREGLIAAIRGTSSE